MLLNYNSQELFIYAATRDTTVDSVPEHWKTLLTSDQLRYIFGAAKANHQTIDK